MIKYFFLVLTVLFSFSQALANTEYAVIVFGFQDSINDPRNAHTYAIFAEWDGVTVKRFQTLSWLAEDGIVKLTKMNPEPGYNFDLPETLEMAAIEGRKQKRWGPVAITPAAYEKATKRIAYLNEKLTQFKVLDSAYRKNPSLGLPGGAVNCIHALSDIGGFIDTGISRGWEASQLVFDHFKPFITDRSKRLEPIAKSIGVDQILREDTPTP